LAKPILAIVKKIELFMSKKEHKIILSWQEYYLLIERSRLNGTFHEKLKLELKSKGIVLNSGVSIVEILKL
jgi:hypothetical protein